MAQDPSLLGEQRWQAMWQALGAACPQRDLRQQLLHAYSEPHRSYHTQQHLAECLDGLDLLRFLAERPAEIELALWFHDAIHDTHARDNEVRSAAWVRRVVLGAGLGDELADRVRALVLTTQHRQLPVSTDEKILIDIDLAILGAAPARFAEYERQIEQEYAWVAPEQRRQTRRRILSSFLERQAIYSSAPFKSQLEQRARRNLRASIAALRTCP